MSGVDELLKLEKLLKIVEEDVKKELEDIEVLSKEELKEFEEKLEEEFKIKREEALEKHSQEMERLKKLHESRKALLLSQMRSSLKSELLGALKDSLERVVSSLDDEERTRYLRYLFDRMKDEVREGDALVCAEGDLERVKRFYEGEVRESGDLKNELMVISKDGRYRVVAGLDDILEDIAPVVGEMLDGKAGDMR